MKKEMRVIASVCLTVTAAFVAYRHYWITNHSMPIARAESKAPLSRFSEPMAAPARAVPSTVFKNAEMLARAKNDPNEHVRDLAEALQNEQSRYDQIASAYEDTHRKYSERIAEHARPPELATYQFHLDELIQDLRSSSTAISTATSELTDAYVAQRLASLGIEAPPKRNR